MRNYLFSPTTLVFYPKDLKSLYEKNKTLPSDVFEVEDSVYKEFGEGVAPFGKTKGFVSGKVSWVDIQTSEEDNKLIESSWVSRELDRARAELEKVQDSDPMAVGSVSSWRDYRKSLRAWPEQSSFPNKEFRPKAPDADKE